MQDDLEEHAGSDEDEGFVDDDDKGVMGKMFVNQHMIKICFKDENSSSTPSKEEKKGSFSAKSGKPVVTPKKAVQSKASISNLKKLKSPKGAKDSGENDSDVISLKYTIDYPRVELHPFDTRKFLLYYADTKVNASYDCNRCIEMRAASRQSRDIIALLIRCFSAQTYFINSKIIASVTEEDENLEEDEDMNLGPKQYSVSDVLCELEQVKRELYNQIDLNTNLSNDKRVLNSQVALVEEEMQMTIESYKSVLEASESDAESDCGKAKTELKQMTIQLEQMTRERQKLLAEKVVMADEKKSLSQMLDRSQ